MSEIYLTDVKKITDILGPLSISVAVAVAIGWAGMPKGVQWLNRERYLEKIRQISSYASRSILYRWSIFPMRLLILIFLYRPDIVLASSIGMALILKTIELIIGDFK